MKQNIAVIAIYLVLVLFPQVDCKAQESDYDNPYLNGFYLGINLNTNNKSTLGGGLDLRNYLLKGRICIDGRFNVNVIKNNSIRNINTRFAEPGIIPLAFPTNGLLAPNDKELGGCYNFSRRSAMHRRMFTVGRVNNAYSRTRFYIFGDATVLWMFGGRVGFGNNRGYFRDSLQSNYGTYITTNPNILDDSLGQDVREFYTNFSNTYSYLGFQFTRVFNVLLQEAGRKVSHLDLYADLILPISKNVRDLSIDNNGSEFVINTVKPNQVNKIGYRFGVKTRAVRYLNGSVSFELGKMPGYNFSFARGLRSADLQYGDLYLKLGFGVNITAPIMKTQPWDFN
jgi:hypothetical protein